MAVLVATVLLAVACAGGGSPPVTAAGRATPSRMAPLPSSTTSLPSLSNRCGDSNGQARAFWFRATDGTLLDGVVLGAGTVGVVLAHQYRADLCGWWAYANVLARKGLRVLLFDFRCFGMSTCPRDASGGLTDDLAGAAGELRRRGVTSLALMGASLGGTVTLMTAPRLDPPPDAVVSLSGVPDLGYLVGSTRLDALSAVPKLRTPVLYVVAEDDRVVSVDETRRMYLATGSKDKRLMVLPASFGHGWNMVVDIRGNTTSASRTVVDFLEKHAS